MRVLGMLFWFWLLLGDMLLVTDLLSYYKLVTYIDWFQVINRELNVEFLHLMVTLPLTILVLVIFPIMFNKLSEKK